MSVTGSNSLLEFKIEDTEQVATQQNLLLLVRLKQSAHPELRCKTQVNYYPPIQMNFPYGLQYGCYAAALPYSRVLTLLAN